MNKPTQSIGKSTLPIYYFTTLKRFHTLMHESSEPAYPIFYEYLYELHFELHLHRSCTYIEAAPTSKLRASCKLDKLRTSYKSSYV